MSTKSVGRLPHTSALRPRISGVSIIVAVALIAAAGIAWAWLLRNPMRDGGMQSMAVVQPWSAAYIVPAATMWAVMMIAMMTPSAAPMVLLHARIDPRLSPAVRLRQTLIFATSYLLVWGVFSVAAAALQVGAVSIEIISARTLSVQTPLAGAALLLLAAAYELTIAKRQCLSQCQSPLLFLSRNYRPGAAGAFRMGLKHGLYCLGCCWVLMLLLFVSGVMNLAWVAVLGVLIICEKQAPAHWYANRWLAALLAMSGFAIVAL